MKIQDHLGMKWSEKAACGRQGLVQPERRFLERRHKGTEMEEKAVFV